MILVALTAAATVATTPPTIQKDLQAPAGPQPKPHLLKELPAARQAYQAPSVLFVDPDSGGLLKHLWISPRVLPDPAHPFPSLDKNLPIGPPGAPTRPGLTLIQAQVAPPKAHIVPSGAARDWTLPPVAERTPNLYKVPDRCKDAPVKVVDRNGRPVAVKLGDLPTAALIYAVDRREDGCPVLVVAYGTPALDNPNPAPPARLRSGVSPPKPEDAPSNRR